jgi:hypothetical protein
MFYETFLCKQLFYRNYTISLFREDQVLAKLNETFKEQLKDKPTDEENVKPVTPRRISVTPTVVKVELVEVIKSKAQNNHNESNMNGTLQDVEDVENVSNAKQAREEKLNAMSREISNLKSQKEKTDLERKEATPDSISQTKTKTKLSAESMKRQITAMREDENRPVSSRMTNQFMGNAREATNASLMDFRSKEKSTLSKSDLDMGEIFDEPSSRDDNFVRDATGDLMSSTSNREPSELFTKPQASLNKPEANNDATVNNFQEPVREVSVISSRVIKFKEMVPRKEEPMILAPKPVIIAPIVPPPVVKQQAKPALQPAAAAEKGPAKQEEKPIKPENKKEVKPAVQQAAKKPEKQETKPVQPAAKEDVAKPKPAAKEAPKKEAKPEQSPQKQQPQQEAVKPVPAKQEPKPTQQPTPPQPAKQEPKPQVIQAVKQEAKPMTKQEPTPSPPPVVVKPVAKQEPNVVQPPKQEQAKPAQPTQQQPQQQPKQEAKPVQQTPQQQQPKQEPKSAPQQPPKQEVKPAPQPAVVKPAPQQPHPKKEAEKPPSQPSANSDDEDDFQPMKPGKMMINNKLVREESAAFLLFSSAEPVNLKAEPSAPKAPKPKPTDQVVDEFQRQNTTMRNKKLNEIFGVFNNKD